MCGLIQTESYFSFCNVKKLVFVPEVSKDEIGKETEIPRQQI